MELEGDDAGVFEEAGDWGGYRGLRVYQLAHELRVEVHRLSFRLPKFELHETGGQWRRASKSISANLVEGYGRRFYKAGYVKFLTYDLASCDETNEWLCYIRDCHEDLAVAALELLTRTEAVGRRLNRFREAVILHHRP